MSEIICELTSDFRGKYPEVPFAEGVDVEAFKNEKNPFFVTLPIAQIGAKSRNGRDFGRPEVERIVNQVNSKKPEGGLGHIPAHERGSRYEMPKARWLGAMIDADGVAWGKAYIPEYAADVREFFKTAKMANARVGTSIYGKEGEAGLADMTLEQIDLGHPDRLGVLEVGAIPKITAELNEENTEANNMAENELVQELRTQRDEKDKLIAELRTDNEKNKKLVSELQTKATQFDAIVAELGENPVSFAKKLVAENLQLKKGQLESAIDGVIAELVTLPQMRKLAKKELINVTSVDEARKLITEFVETEDYQEIAKAMALKVSGGRAIVTELRDDKGQLREPTAVEIARARAEWGI